MRPRPAAIGIFAAALAAALLLAATAARAEWPTKGGDTGDVIEVTSLADSGPGTLRSALALKVPRRIVFKVGGEIWLKSPLVIREPSVTVAGETAPSPGISLFGDKLRIRTHDVIVRHIRIRVGELPGNSNPDNRDGISIDLGAGTWVGNVIIDHCSIAWSIDEALAVWGVGIKNVLIRDTIVAEALSHSIHPKGDHSMGLLVGKGASNVVVERNLLAHNRFRNPVIDAGASAVVVNNLIYDPGWSAFHVYAKPKVGPTLASVVGNLLITGPSSRSVYYSFPKGVNPGSQIYYAHNKAIGAKAFDPKERSDLFQLASAPPLWFDWIKTLPVDQVEDKVLADVGARPDDRDETDKRIVAEVMNRGGSVRDTPVDKRLRATRPEAGDAGQ